MALSATGLPLLGTSVSQASELLKSHDSLLLHVGTFHIKGVIACCSHISRKHCTLRHHLKRNSTPKLHHGIVLSVIGHGIIGPYVPGLHQRPALDDPCMYRPTRIAQHSDLASSRASTCGGHLDPTFSRTPCPLPFTPLPIHVGLAATPS